MDGNGIAEANGVPRHRKREWREKSGLYTQSKKELGLRDKRVERLARKVRSILPWIEPSDWPIAYAWSELELLCRDVHGHLRQVGLLNDKGEGRRLLDDYRRLRQTQVVFSRELGLTPAARQTLRSGSKNTTFDLPTALAKAHVDEVAVDDSGDQSDELKRSNYAMEPEPVVTLEALPPTATDGNLSRSSYHRNQRIKFGNK